MNVILSIKPQFANAIFEGIKKVEFRKTLFKESIENVIVYSSSPVKKLIGSFTITDIKKASPRELWDLYGEIGGIAEEKFFEYFKDKEEGYSICIGSTEKFSQYLDPFEMIENFVPPQSFCYYDGIL